MFCSCAVCQQTFATWLDFQMHLEWVNQDDGVEGKVITHNLVGPDGRLIV